MDKAESRRFFLCSGLHLSEIHRPVLSRQQDTPYLFILLYTFVVDYTLPVHTERKIVVMTLRIDVRNHIARNNFLLFFHRFHVYRKLTRQQARRFGLTAHDIEKRLVACSKTHNDGIGSLFKLSHHHRTSSCQRHDDRLVVHLFTRVQYQ